MRRLAFVTLIVALIGAVGVSEGMAGQRAAGKALIVALDQSDVKTLDPGRQFEYAAQFIDLNCYDTLLASKGGSELTTYVPALATEWSVSKDGKEYTFKLRKNVKFASGNPFTAEDVRFTLMRLKNVKGNPAWLMDPLKEIQVVDSHTVKMVLSDPFGDWLALLTGPNSGILDAKLAKEHGASDSATADKDDKSEEWLNQNSAGSGPFVLKGWLRSNAIKLERNPNYWREGPKVARVEIRDVPSRPRRSCRWRTGTWISPSTSRRSHRGMRGNKNIKIITGQSLDNMYLGLTTGAQIHQCLAKKEVRQAIRHAIDYDGIIALTNKQAVAVRWFTPSVCSA